MLLAVMAPLVAGALTNVVDVATNVPAGARSVMVSWPVPLAAVPVHVMADMASPQTNGAGARMIRVTPVLSTYTTTNLVLNFSGITDTTGYVATASVWQQEAG